MNAIKQKYLIGVDIGTQGTKAGLFRNDGTTLSTSFRASRLHQPTPGVVEEDPEHQLKAVCYCIKRCIADAAIDASQIAAIGIDGQMAGILGIGEEGRAITPYDSWLDTRCAPYIDVMSQQAGHEIIRKTGAAPSFNHGPKMLWWKHEHAKTYHKIASFVQPSAYCIMRLCGLAADQAFIDTTYLHFSGFANTGLQRWDRSLCQKFDIDATKLPRIVSPTEIVGSLTAPMARRCGIVAGIPCIAGCGDSVASWLACGATRAGICVDIAGTASVFATTTSEFTPDTENNVLGWARSATPGLWHPFAYINGGGMNLEWFAKELATLGRGKKEQTFEQLGRLAAKIVPHRDNPMFVPHLGGRVTPSQPQLRGSWTGLSWAHTAGHLFHAMMEAVALEYCIYKQTLTSLNPDLRLRELRITGGGEKSAVWNQMKADALTMRVVSISRSDGAPLGVAMLAGHGIGLFKSLDSVARSWITTKEVARPRRQQRQFYEDRLTQYQRLLSLLDQWANNKTK